MKWAPDATRGHPQNLAQVDPLYFAYLERWAELDAAGRYPYNDDFRGTWPDVEFGPGPPKIYGTDEDTAIYLCQCRRAIEEVETRALGALEDGFVPLTEAPTDGARFAEVIAYAFVNGETGWRRWEQARIVVAGGRDHMMLLPKGKRTHGYNLSAGRVLVKP